jgi:hypothetical protein
MKKRLSLFLATLVTIVAMPAATFAAAGQTDVNGTVTNGGAPVKNAIVEVTCGSTTKQAHTDASGAYLVVFNIKKCPAGSSVQVNASKKHVGSGASTGTVSPQNTDRLNVAIVNVSLPEFGLVGLIGATFIGGGAFLVMRRRQLSGHQA